MKLRAPALALALCMVVPAGGCATSDLLLDDRSVAAESEGYTATLRRWTKHHKVYRHFEALIFTTATYLSPEFRQALVNRRTRLLGLPGSEARRVELEHRERSRRYHEFVVSVYTAERRWNDLDAEPSMWRVSLANDRGQEVSPSEVIRQDLRSGDLQAYFPYITVFQQAYLVRFPKQSLEFGSSVIDSTTQSFQLRFLSGIAVSELNWTLDVPISGAAGEAPVPGD